MPTLLSAKIRNFESHRNTTLNFHPGLNVIVGATDEGKSCILRALRWLFRNDPLGEDVKSNWLENINTYVQGEFDDGIIKRKRTKDFNGYILNGDLHSGFKKQIPDVIKSFINMSDINFLDQDDPLFMISWSPSERGRYLNEICDMKIIDTTTSNINKQIRAENAKIKVLKETLETDETALENFEDLNELERKVSEVETKTAQIQKLNEDSENLADIIANFHRVDKRRQEYASVLQFSNRISTLTKRYQEIKVATADIQKLNGFIDDLLNRTNRLETLKENQKKYKAEFKKLMPERCPLCGK